MNKSVAALIGLLAASTPALAPDSAAAKRSGLLILLAQAGAPASGSGPAGARADPVAAKRPRGRGNAQPGAPVPAVYASMPPAARLAIVADLAWTGYDEGPPSGDLDARAIEAIKLFQKANRGKETGILSDQERARLAAAAKGPQDAAGWRLVDDPQTGARIGVPEKVVSYSGATPTGTRWASGRGQIQIETFRFSEASLPALFDEEKKSPRQRQVESSALTPSSFVLSGTQNLKLFVVTAQAGGTEVRGMIVLYDQATSGTMGPVALAMAATFQGFPDPSAGPPPGQRRRIEYGTAVAVDGEGHLVTAQQVTAGCLSLVVPGYRAADRIAADETSGLALVRIYGAHGLAPTPLADRRPGDTLTLVGIADPLAQDGGGAVTRLPAHLDGQAIEPRPKPGFAGAAALDAEGRLAGILDLKVPALAGPSPAPTPQAVLVPAETVRVFLNAHGITPAGGPVVTEPSVVRLICVRK